MVDSVGFVGLGIMGRPMALNLVKAGYKLHIFARRPERTQVLVNFGAQVHNSCRQVAEQSDVIITMLSDSKQVQSVILGEDGLAKGACPGTIIIDMSTIDPSVCRSIALKLAEQEVEMIDAPVSGGEQGAKDGGLSIMVGGKIPIFRKIKPILQMMGTSSYIGESGSGQLAKACNQVLISQTLVAVAETLLLAEAAGIDPALLQQALLSGSAYSKILEIHGKRMLERDFDPGFSRKLHKKDLQIIHKLENQLGIKLPIQEHVSSIINSISEDEESDSANVLVQLEKKIGITLRNSKESKTKKIR